MNLNMSKEEILALSMDERMIFSRLQSSKWKRTVIVYDAFVELSPEIQNKIMSVLKSNLEEWFDITRSFTELFERIKREGFEVKRGDSGIHKDLVMFTFNNYYNDSFLASEIGFEWLKQNNLDKEG